jgi:putative ABC transport system permease protein
VCLTLALATGLATAMFAIVNAVILAPLAVEAPDRVVAVWEARPGQESLARVASSHNVASWLEGTQAFEALGVWRDWGMRLQTAEGPEPVLGALASADLFTVLRTRPVLGRVFGRDEDVPGRNSVVLISHAFWRTRFAEDPAVLGTSITLSRAPAGPRPFTIVGVLPPEMLPSMSDYQLWVPASVDPDRDAGRGLRNRRALGRLRDGVAIEAARVQLDEVAQRLARQFPDSNAGWRVQVVSIADAELGGTRRTLVRFSVAIGLLLLIGCANVAGLLLARAAGRTREIGIRVALGASRARIVRLLVAESLVLATIGAAGGGLLAAWLLAVFGTVGPSLPRDERIGIDPWTWGFAAGLALLTGVLCGLLPALSSARVEPAESVKAGRSFGRLPALRLRSVLVAGEIALALVLVVGAALTLRSLNAMLSTPLGVDSRDLLVFQVFPPAAKYTDRAALVTLYTGVTDRLRALPGVTQAGAVSAGPLFGGREPVRVRIAGAPRSDPADAPQARFFDADGAYFSTVGMRLMEGRTFGPQDTMTSPPVAVVNASFARLLTPRGAVGERVIVEDDAANPLEIVGVVSDIRHELDPSTPPAPEIYWPMTQRPRWATYFVVRTEGPAVTAAGIRDALRQIDPAIVPTQVSSLEGLIDRSSRRPRFDTGLLGAFAVLALVLCGTGLYGLVAYAVAQRTREIAVRVSLGASASTVVGVVLGHAMRAAGAGILLGLAGAVAFARVMSALLVGIGPFDPVAFLAAAVLVALVTLAACAVPVRHALRIEPIAALRVD